MSWLLAIYPRSWRQRYGDELLALLEERGLTVQDILDLACGAIDAHLHLRHRIETNAWGNPVVASPASQSRTPRWIWITIGLVIWVALLYVATMSFDLVTALVLLMAVIGCLATGGYIAIAIYALRLLHTVQEDITCTGRSMSAEG